MYHTVAGNCNLAESIEEEQSDSNAVHNANKKSSKNMMHDHEDPDCGPLLKPLTSNKVSTTMKNKVLWAHNSVLLLILVLSVVITTLPSDGVTCREDYK